MKEKLIRFMQGRYGIDQLSKFLLITGLAVVLLSAFFGETAVSMLLYIFGWGVVIYCYFRIFSRNVQKRYAENQAYLMKTYKIRNWFQNQKNIWQQRKVYHIYTCPSCKQKIRIPKGKGFIADTLSMLVNIFAPRKIVLFGELAELGDILLDGVRERVSENIIKENSNGLKIMASEFGRNLGAMGAAAMVMQNAFEFLEEKI